MKSKNASIVRFAISWGCTALLGAAAYVVFHLRESYAPVKEKPHSSKPVITAMGDSITFGAGVAKTRKTDAWVYLLEKLLEGKYQVLNYGISGATLQDEGNFPYWNMKQKMLQGFPEAALALNPEIVILMLGTNDSKPYNWNAQRYEKELYARVQEILAHASVKRLILMCPPFATGKDDGGIVPFDIQNEIIRDYIVPAVKKCAAETGVECIDLYALTEGHKEYLEDGVHPNREGNKIIAECIQRHICRCCKEYDK